MTKSVDDKATIVTDIVAVLAKKKIMMTSQDSIKLADHRFIPTKGFTLETSVYLQFQPLISCKQSSKLNKHLLLRALKNGILQIQYLMTMIYFMQFCCFQMARYLQYFFLYLMLVVIKTRNLLQHGTLSLIHI